MRQALVQTLSELAAVDGRIILLTADLGYSILEPFAKKFPDRFLNVGVAEQNMLGVATGLAEAGFIPFVYSIAPFASLRPYEFIRNGPILHHLPVRILGIGGGFDYEFSGPSHYSLEDIGVMRIQPGLRVIVPADHQQARSALRATWDQPGPTYYRFGKDDQSIVPGLTGQFELGKAQFVRDGKDIALVAMGSIALEAAKAAEDLQKQGVSVSLVIVASVNPPPGKDLAEHLSHFRQVVTVEEHYTVGGLGSLVAETTADHGLGCKVRRLGVAQPLDGTSGRRAVFNEKYGISAPAIVRACLEVLQ